MRKKEAGDDTAAPTKEKIPIEFEIGSNNRFPTFKLVPPGVSTERRKQPALEFSEVDPALTIPHTAFVAPRGGQAAQI